MIKQIIQAPTMGNLCRYAALVKTKADDNTPIVIKTDIYYLALLDNGEIKPVIYSENGTFEIFEGEIYDRG